MDKYYLDVVFDDGAGCIAYAAHARSLGLAATLSATIEWKPGQTPRQNRTLRGTLPTTARGQLDWHCPALGARGSWSPADSAAAPIVLWQDGSRHATWQLLAPRARVQLQTDAGQLSGWGYAERLELEGAPWHLPIDGLRWGRYVSARHSLVWIAWQHATPRRWLWHDGHLTRDFTVSDTGVVWPTGRLALGPPHTLRSGQLRTTAFARWPGLHRSLPRRLLAFNETKWCAPAAFRCAGEPADRGWVIHELVHFR